jgi:hypothetical protein
VVKITEKIHNDHNLDPRFEPKAAFYPAGQTKSAALLGNTLAVDSDAHSRGHRAQRHTATSASRHKSKREAR